MYSQWVIYGFGPAYLNNSWGLWSFLLSWGPYRNGQGLRPWINEFFLMNCSLPPDFQQLCSCFLWVWLGITPFCGSCPELTVVVITTGPSLAYLSGLKHASAAPRDDIMFSWESANLRVQNTSLMEQEDTHRGLDVSSQHYGHGSLHLWRYKGKKFITVDADIYKGPHSLAHPYLPILDDTDTPKEQPNGTGLSEGHVSPSGIS